jgi:PAS domain S-box-containing protein
MIVNLHGVMKPWKKTPGGNIPVAGTAQRTLVGQTHGTPIEKYLLKSTCKTFLQKFQASEVKMRRFSYTLRSELQREISVNIDVTKPGRAEGAPRESEERLRQTLGVRRHRNLLLVRTIIETAADAIVIMDDRGLIQSVNRAVERIFGYSPDEVIGRNVDMLVPKAHVLARDAIAGLRRTGERKIIDIGREVEGRRKDGALFPLDLATAESRDARGRRFFAGIMRDITDRKRREAQIHLLMREVNHRSQNLLAVIQSLARLTANSSRPEEFAERLIARLQGLSQSQNLIVCGDWQHVALNDLVRAQLSHLGETLCQRVRIDGEPIMVTPAAAQGIGMALHELAANAIKYGALSANEGQVSIAWSRSAQERGRRFIMTWSEHGGPPVLTPAYRGFGRTLIEEVTAFAVGGEVACHFEHSGLCWNLDAPEDEILS